MRISFQMTDDILIATAEGELDHHSAAVVREEIDKTMDTFGCRHLIMDLGKLTFMDSSGIGVVLGRYNRLHEKGGEVFLADCSEYVERILFMAGVFTLAPKRETVEDAIDGIRGQEQIEMEVAADEK